jgi:hypothetical protein
MERGGTGMWVPNKYGALFMNYMQTYQPKNYLIESMQATTYSS